MMRCARAAGRVDLGIMTDLSRHLNATVALFVQFSDLLSSAVITTHLIALTEELKCFHNTPVKQENISCLSSTLSICLRCPAVKRTPRSPRVAMSSHQT